MPLVDQLKQFSEPGNPEGVCLINSAITAHVLMSGPDSLHGKETLKLPLTTGEEEFELAKIKTGEADPAATLDVNRLGGKEGAWTPAKEQTPEDNGRNMITWLASSDAKAGVYVASVGGEEDDHYFNVVKTDEGQLYLMDSSQHNFIELRGPSDVNMAVKDGAEKVLFSKMYCDETMKLDYCGALHPDCKQALKAEVRRTVAQEVGMKPSVSSGTKAAVKVS
ncbi:MAG TPA: hypothetical protein VLE43_20095 [Candidatus Saccharimonadia bacterium]|nr:hypothetical protein [Candidatus Saccharimonadia bacterium]